MNSTFDPPARALAVNGVAWRLTEHCGVGTRWNMWERPDSWPFSLLHVWLRVPAGYFSIRVARRHSPSRFTGSFILKPFPDGDNEMAANGQRVLTVRLTNGAIAVVWGYNRA